MGVWVSAKICIGPTAPETSHVWTTNFISTSGLEAAVVKKRDELFQSSRASGSIAGRGGELCGWAQVLHVKYPGVNPLNTT